MSLKLPEKFLSWRIGELLPLFCLSFGAVIWLRMVLFFLGFDFPVSYGEGPLLDQALRLSELKQIYKPISAVPPWTVSNYPPVYPVIQVPLLKIFGAHFWIPRLVSATASLVSVVLVGLITKKVSGSRVAGLWAAAFFMLSPVNMYWGYLGRVDAAAVALALCGIYFALGSSEDDSGLLFSAFFLVLAVATRQTAIILGPGLAVAWLLIHKRFRDLFWFAGLSVAAIMAVFFSIDYLTGGGFYQHIIEANINEFDFHRIGLSAEILVCTWPVSLAALLCLLLSHRITGAEKNWLAAFTLLAACASLLIAKKGSDVNYLYESSLLLSVSGGYGFARLPVTGIWRKAVAVLLVMQAALLLWQGSMLFWPQYQGAIKREKQLEYLSARTRETGGPVLADQFIGVEVINGQPVYYQPFEMLELMKRGLWNDEPLISALQRKEFKLISIYLPYRENRWSSRQMDVILENYKTESCEMNFCIYSPKPELK